MAEGKHLAKVVHFGDQQVFEGATTYTCLMFLDKAGADACSLTKVDDLDAWRIDGKGIQGDIPAGKIPAAEWNFVVGEGAKVQDAFDKWPVKLGDIAERMAQGIRTSANEVYVLDLVRENGDIITAHSKILDRDVELERNATSLFLQGREIKPYRVLPSGKVVIMPYTIHNGRAILIPENEIQKQFPLLHAYLSENKDYLVAREKGRFRGAEWFQYGRQQNIDLMLLPKILVPDIAERASFALDEGGDYAFTSGYGITLRSDVKESPKYILALLNSSSLDSYLKSISTTMRGGFFRYFTQFIERLPIRRIDFTKPTEKKVHDQLVGMVDQIMLLHRQLAAAKSPPDKEALTRQLGAIARQIDTLVCGLYGVDVGACGDVAGHANT